MAKLNNLNDCTLYKGGGVIPTMWRADSGLRTSALKNGSNAEGGRALVIEKNVDVIEWRTEIDNHDTADINRIICSNGSFDNGKHLIIFSTNEQKSYYNMFFLTKFKEGGSGVAKVEGSIVNTGGASHSTINILELNYYNGRWYIES